MIGHLKESPVKLKRVFFESKLPEMLSPLRELANNLWWSWNSEAEGLYKYIDEERFKQLEYNPIALLDEIDPQKVNELINDAGFMSQLKKVYKAYQSYIGEAPAIKSPSIAYFSMEYGLHISLHLYSGGLGVLAGDYLKEASDSNVNLVAVGLLYRYGYFQQAISLYGDQIDQYHPQKFTKLPIKPVRDQAGEWLKVNVSMKGRMIFAKVWELKIGRISLFLLDADIDENNWEDRSLTHQLYGGDNEHRLRQEILLGIGGVRVLNALGIQSDIYHCNEGHAAFLNLERLKNFMEEENLTYEEALQVVRATSLFTTHTPVPAGHDYFSESLLSNYLYGYVLEMGINWNQFVGLGKIDSENPHELFSMSHLAIRLSQEVNGVSMLHGLVSQKMFNNLYPGYHPEELHISYVTNSVHYPTWIAKEWHDLYVQTFGKAFLQDQSNKKYWRKIHEVADEKIMGIRKALKARLIEYVKQTLQADLTRRGENPRAIFEFVNKIKNDALIIGFARRFATYKRAQLLFSNQERLAQLVNQAGRPVIFIFAGKAHPADRGGQDLIKHIISISKKPEFAGKVIFMENYNMEMAKLLVQGVDIWMNTPTRPKEASGTSGMKAAMNGVMNFSVLDGWWVEGYRPDAGWSLPMESTYEDQSLQNELDAESIYNTLEFDIIPKYYDQDENGISRTWVSYIKNIVAEVAPQFTMKRMLDDYYERFYNKLGRSGAEVKEKFFEGARKLAAWKAKTKQSFYDVRLLSIDSFDSDNYALEVGKPFQATLQLDLGAIAAEHLGVEIVFFSRASEAELNLKFSQELKLLTVKGQVATYECQVNPNLVGVYEYGFRIFPKHPLLPHRQELPLVKWL
ncbi:MAG TPA: alpha-glucan family phosphorylase [Saprospiraceae bacterium]|nr:alpha-glucan family phosphorylase [Saprospiraceae bacterium]HMQ83104.1 alpha-glucan family phosphorylase [Saprospiraceae bacterium]